MDLRTSIWLVFMIITFADSKRITDHLRFCIVESTHTIIRIRSLCPKLITSGSPITCVTDVDRFSCLRRLMVGDADFIVLEPEDLLAAAAYSEYNILITNELRVFPNDEQHFQMVVVVHKSVKHIWDVKGKRFCHPGLETDKDWTKIFSTYFGNWIIPQQCDPDKTLLENHIYAMSNYFDMACIPGPWSLDMIYDNKLKLKYKNLCNICDNPGSCYTSDKYYGREGSLLCLTDNVGDIAWARLDDARVHFENEKINKSDYSYLCPDGGTMPTELNKPCTWISKPWPVVVARSQMAEKVAEMMNALRNTSLVWETSVLQLLESYHITPVSTENLETPEDYLRRFTGFLSANNRASCRPSRRVQWCVASNLEDRKCRWLREASIVYGVEPSISCIQQANRASCLEAVRSRRADIFVARPDELLQARKKGLQSIVHAMSNKKQEMNRIVAIVKKDSKFKILKDLKGAKACFTGYKSVGWNAFVSLMKNASIDWACSDAVAVARFFKDSCVHGLSNKDKNELPANLYSLCKQEGSAGDDVSTFDCLASGLADVVFVNLKAVEKESGNFEHGVSENKEYRILCLNEPDADNENPCWLTWTAFSSIVGHENMTDLTREEIYSMLLEMDHLFGITFEGQTPAFSLYGTYDTNHSVIFPEETRHLQLHDQNHQIKRVRSYDQIIEEISKEDVCSVASTWVSNFPDILILYIVFVLSRFLIC